MFKIHYNAFIALTPANDNKNDKEAGLAWLANFFNWEV